MDDAPVGEQLDLWSDVTGPRPGTAAGIAQATRRKRSRRTRLTVALMMLVVGLGVAGYAAYRYWGTGWSTARAQAQMEREFETRVETASPPDAEAVATTAPAGATVVVPDPEDPPDPDDDPLMHGTVVVDSDPPPDVIIEAHPPQGEVLGRMVIPAIGFNWMVVEGVRASDLAQGPGHGPWTPLPGQQGNAMISGHRTTYGAPFSDIDLLEAGDRIAVETIIGIHLYEVVSTAVVEPDAMWVTDQWDGAWLTLSTCHPEYRSTERFVVFAKLIDGPNYEAISVAGEVSYDPPTPPG